MSIMQSGGYGRWSWVVIITALFLNICMFCPARADTDYALTYQNLSRLYVVHLPTGYKAGVATPVVFVLHGGGGNPDEISYDSGMDAVADKNNFIVVYPAGTALAGSSNSGLYWNDGRKYYNGTYSSVDDVGFIKAVIKDLSNNYTIDNSRVYAAGLSNGASMCYTLVKELPGLFAAIAPIAGQQEPNQVVPAPQGSVSIIAFEGMQDPLVPYNGGYAKSGVYLTYVYPVTKTMSDWAVHDGYLGQTIAGETINNAVETIYSPLSSNGEVILWTLEDGGHTWPGGKISNAQIGAINMDISASTEMWDFFASISNSQSSAPSVPIPSSVLLLGSGLLGLLGLAWKGKRRAG
jgi:polyhydroxybutyrate depolymerase